MQHWKKKKKSQNVFLSLFILLFVFFGVCISLQYFFGEVLNQTSNWEFTPEVSKRRPKVYQKDVSHDRIWNFDHWKIFYKI